MDIDTVLPKPVKPRPPSEVLAWAWRAALLGQAPLVCGILYDVSTGPHTGICVGAGILSCTAALIVALVVGPPSPPRKTS